MVIVPDVEGETAGDGDSDPNRGDRDSDDGDGTTSGSSVDSSQVKAVRLAVLSGSPTSPADRLYGHVRRRCGCGRIKFEPIKVNTAQKDETTYLERMSAVQPHGNILKHCLKGHRPRWRHRRIKIGPGTRAQHAATRKHSQMPP